MVIQSFILISLIFSSYAIRGMGGLQGLQFLFTHFAKKIYKTQTCNSIAAICGTNEERVMVDSPTKFAVNLRNIQGVMSVYSH